MSDEQNKINEKRQQLRALNKHCIKESNYYRRRYKRLKIKDDFCDVSHTCLNMSAVALTISGIGLPPLLIASAACAGLGLVVSQAQKTFNSKVRLTNYNVATLQYEELAREINAVLLRNHCSSQQYLEYIEDVNSKLNMINDSKLL